MAAQNLEEDILTLDNELIVADEEGGEGAVPSEPGVLLLHNEIPADPPIRKIEVRPRKRARFGYGQVATDAVEDEPRTAQPRLAWSSTSVSQRNSASSDEGGEEITPFAQSLADAHQFAAVYRFVEARTRNALYEALGAAHDLALMAQDNREEYGRALVEAGIEVSERAPMVALVKLVFGKDYDKTRLSEFATVIEHCQRRNLELGEATKFIASTTGGIRQIIAMERLLRHGADDQAGPTERTAPRKAIVRKLSRIPAHGLELLEGRGDEYVLVIARRDPSGTPALLGEVPRDIALLEKAARKLIAEGRF